MIKIKLGHQWNGRGTYAHPFPLQLNVLGDFFGNESMVAIWNQGTSSEKPSTF